MEPCRFTTWTTVGYTIVLAQYILYSDSWVLLYVWICLCGYLFLGLDIFRMKTKRKRKTKGRCVGLGQKENESGVVETEVDQSGPAKFILAFSVEKWTYAKYEWIFRSCSESYTLGVCVCVWYTVCVVFVWRTCTFYLFIFRDTRKIPEINALSNSGVCFFFFFWSWCFFILRAFEVKTCICSVDKNSYVCIIYLSPNSTYKKKQNPNNFLIEIQN